MSDNIYNILKNFNKLTEEKVEIVPVSNKKSKLQESVDQVNEKYMGFKKTVAAIKKGGSAENPEAVAAAIGRKKYGKEKFQKAAAAGKKLGEGSQVTDYNPKSQGGTRKELLAKYKKTKDPKDATAARKAGATQKELQNMSEATGDVKFDAMMEGSVVEKAPPTAKAKRMAKHIKTGYKGSGLDKEEVAQRAFGATWKAYKKGKLDEAIHNAFQQGYTTNQIVAMLKESDDDYWKNLMKKPASVGKTVHKGSYGTAYQGDDDDDDDGQQKKKSVVPAGEKKGRGRPKGSKNREVKAGVKKAASGEARGRGRPAGSKNKVRESWIIENNKFIAEAFASLIKEAGGEVWTADMKDPKTGKPVPPPSPPDMGSIRPAPIRQQKPPQKKLNKRSEIDVDQSIAETDFEEMRKLAGLEEKLHGKQHVLDVDKDGDIESTDLAKLRAGKKSMEEGDMEEGNAFSNAVRKAKADGIQPGETISVGGKTYDLKEEQIDECGVMGSAPYNAPAEQPSGMNISTNMNSDGNKDVTVTARGKAAEELMQILALAGMEKPSTNMVDSDVQVVSMEEKDPRYHANTTPEEEVLPLETQIKGGDGDVAGREKKMNKNGSARFRDNPLAVKNESVSLNFMKEYEAIKVKL